MIMGEAEVMTETQMAKEIASKTTEAIKDIGLDPDFESAFTGALAKDDAAKDKAVAPKPEPESAPVEPKPEPKPVTDQKKVEPPKQKTIPDIPDVLLAPKKEEPKPPTEDDREKFIAEQTKGLSPKAADRFRNLERLKHEAEQRAAKLPDLEKQLSSLNEKLKTQQDNSEVERLRRQVTELDEALTRANLLEHPKFKARYDGEIQNQIKIAKQVVGSAHEAEVEVLLSLPETKERNARLAEIVSELDPIKEFKLKNAISEVDALSAQKNTELTNWRENGQRLQELSQKEQEKIQAERQQQLNDAFSMVQKRFGDDTKGVELFRKLKDNDDWNHQVDERFKKVETILKAQNLSAENMAEMAAWAVAGNEYRTRFLVQHALVRKLQEELNALKGGEPDLGEGQASDTEIPAANGIDAIVQAAQKAGLVR